MSNRRVQIVLICEDSQQEAFVRRFLEQMGHDNRNIRVFKSPKAHGSAEQWVKQKFPEELKIYRNRCLRAASALVAIIDADKYEVSQRISQFESECVSKSIPFRTVDEAVAIGIPRRNVETWIHYLYDESVNEGDEYPKLQRERNCRTAVTNLLDKCKTTGLPANAPPSLLAACAEYRTRIQPLIH
jgi:hypothetical protein